MQSTKIPVMSRVRDLSGCLLPDEGDMKPEKRYRGYKGPILEMPTKDGLRDV